jgi:hypothetical protein
MRSQNEGFTTTDSPLIKMVPKDTTEEKQREIEW